MHGARTFAGGSALPIAFILAACGSSRNSFEDARPDAGIENGSFDPGAPSTDEKTTLKGRVYDPAGVNPLYNVMVYVPRSAKREDLPPLRDTTRDGVACEMCSSVIVDPIRSALTSSKGEFVLEDVPVGSDLPLVVQIGKWRRFFHVATIVRGENEIPDGVLRLPRNAAEGDMPHVAVTSGGWDALECLLRGIGIDERESVQGHDTSGHVHLFKGLGGEMGAPAETLWKDVATLGKYDMVLMSCEGVETVDNKGDDGLVAMRNYLDAGGRVFATHYHYVWFTKSPEEEVRDIAEWLGGLPAATYDVNRAFPKGERFAEWLKETGASPTLGRISLDNTTTRSSVSRVYDPAVAWIRSPRGTPKYFTFNTPLLAETDKQCGRAVFSDLHMVTQSEAHPSTVRACSVSAGVLNAQQKALEFFFFDLSACVLSDQTEPQPPK